MNREEGCTIIPCRTLCEQDHQVLSLLYGPLMGHEALALYETMLALGADAVGIGRPYVVAVYGGEQDGANIYTQKIYWELQNIMRLANCRTLSDITEDKLFFLNRSR